MKIIVSRAKYLIYLPKLAEFSSLSLLPVLYWFWRIKIIITAWLWNSY